MKKNFIIIGIIFLLIVGMLFYKNQIKYREEVVSIDLAEEREIVGNEWFETFRTEEIDENGNFIKSEFVDEAYDIISEYDPKLPE